MTCRFEPAFMVRGEGWQKGWFLGGRGNISKTAFFSCLERSADAAGLFAVMAVRHIAPNPPAWRRRDSKGTTPWRGIRETASSFPHSPLAQNDLSTPWAALRRPRQYGATLRTRPRGGEGIPKGQLLGGGFEERRPHSRIPLSPRTTCQRRGRPSAAHGSTAHRSKPARRAGKGFQRDWSLWQGVRGTASPEDGGFSRGSIPLKRGFRGTQSH